MKKMIMIMIIIIIIKVITPISKTSMIITKTKGCIFKAHILTPHFAWSTICVSFIENYSYVGLITFIELVAGGILNV
jgi:hypothetical protein